MMNVIDDYTHDDDDEQNYIMMKMMMTMMMTIMMTMMVHIMMNIMLMSTMVMLMSTMAIRFTPATEIELCGHATLGAAYALYWTRRVPWSDSIRFTTVTAGELTVSVAHDLHHHDHHEHHEHEPLPQQRLLQMDFPSLPPVDVSADMSMRSNVCEALAIDDADVCFIGQTKTKIVAEVTRSAFAKLLDVAIDHAKIARLLNTLGFVLTCRGGRRAHAEADADAEADLSNRSDRARRLVEDESIDFLSRFFAPRSESMLTVNHLYHHHHDHHAI